MSALIDERPEIITRKRHSALNRFRLWRRAGRAARDADWGRERMERYAASVSGDWPEASSEGLVLGACNDLYYWRFAITLLLSIERHGQAQDVHLHLARPRPETLEHVRRLQAGLRHVRLTCTWDDGSLGQRLPFRTVYLTAMRFLVADRILARTGRPLLCLDVDAIAVQPLGPAIASLIASGGDVQLIRRPEKKAITQKILAAAVGVQPTAAGLRFASALARAIVASLDMPPRYHVDQILIHLVMQALVERDALAVTPMPTGLADHGFGAGSTIWMPKGWALKNSDQYAQAKAAVDAYDPDLAAPAEGAEG